MRSAYAGLLLGLFFGTAVLAMTYRDNTVKVPVGGDYSNVTATYVIESYSITDGQDPDGNISAGVSRTFTQSDDKMTWSIGRKESTKVAKWWVSNVGKSHNTFDQDPGELNFAFMGTLTITLTGGILKTNSDTYTLQGIAFGQGSDWSANNWWFGGQNCSHDSGNTVKCAGTSSAGYPVNFVFERGGNAVDEVKLKSVEFPAYTLFPLLSKYAGEDTGCSWQPETICPPFVTYYSDAQKATLVLFVREGRLINTQNKPFDTTGADGRVAIFVMSKDSRIYASNAEKKYMFHHSSIAAGASVAAAGELTVIDGVIQSMDTCSGHYAPSAQAILQLQEGLHRQGYTRPFTAELCPRVLRDDM